MEFDPKASTGLCERLRKSIREVRGLSGTVALASLANIGRQLLEADHGALLFVRPTDPPEYEVHDAAGWESRPEPLSKVLVRIDSHRRVGIPSELAESKLTPDLVTGMTSDLEPLLAVPLADGTGLLGVVRHRGGRPFTEAEGALLGMFSEFAVFTIQNLRQQAEVDRLLAKLAGINAHLDTKNALLDMKAAELEKASRLKSAFLATISHELRTPLAAIIGFAELLLEGVDGDLSPVQAEDIGQIRGSSKLLLGLINDLLDLSKIESGRMTLEIDDLQIGVIVNDVIVALKPLAADRGIYLEGMPATERWFRADRTRISQVLTNLVSNAIKFTENGGVTIWSEEVEGWLEIAVEDTGVGIAEDALDRIFDDFVQAEDGTTRRFGGTGLGLSISRKLVELHGGTIGVESKIGWGSRFWCRLPISDEAGPFDQPKLTDEPALPAVASAASRGCL